MGNLNRFNTSSSSAHSELFSLHIHIVKIASLGHSWQRIPPPPIGISHGGLRNFVQEYPPPRQQQQQTGVVWGD